MNITVSQTNSLDRVLPHPVTNPVIKPVVEGNFLEETPVTGAMHELLLRVQKDQDVFWVGAAIPLGTVDFSKLQVFFHPTVRQGYPPNVIVHAREEDYALFAGGWSGSLQRYVPMQGGQLAAAGRLVPLIVPFTTMGALSGGRLSVFGIDPVATLHYIVAAIQSSVNPLPLPSPQLQGIGVSSFSSGIGAMKMFVAAMNSSGLLREIIDFDSAFIIGNPAELVAEPGVVSSCYTQHFRPSAPLGYRYLASQSFQHIASFGGVPHTCIGSMMYYTAMLTSVL